MSTPTPSIRVSPESGDEDFVILDSSPDLAVRSKEPEKQTAPRILVNPLPQGDAFLVSVQPPAAPSSAIKHVPCDIVLVIDISGSMASLAPLPGTGDEAEKESAGLSVLDLVRHASKTIISTLNQGDRLALITFANEAKVVQQLQNMTEDAKSEVVDKIGQLVARGATNLWAGIKAGLQQFEQDQLSGNVQGLFILTDGLPNYMCPPQGYIPKLRPALADLFSSHQSAPTIQTFGFGYNIRSNLMLSIAEAGNGSFAFIPEVGMIGTVFVHAVANLYATFATNSVLNLTLTSPNGGALKHDSGLPVEQMADHHLRIKLGNLMFGQSRDIVVWHSLGQSVRDASVSATLAFRPSSQVTADRVSTMFALDVSPVLSQSVLSYHLMRNALCKAISALYPVDELEQRRDVSDTTLEATRPDFDALIQRLASISHIKSDQDLSSLLADLVGAQLDPANPKDGQIYQAMQTAAVLIAPRVYRSYWQRWGRHYLASLWCAHMRQSCNSFKDPGPLRYGCESETFKRCRDELDAAFDNIPPPIGTHVRHDSLRSSNGGPVAKSSVHMSSFNRRENPCFWGSCLVKLADGSMARVADLKPNTTIHSPLVGKSMKVAAVIKTSTSPGTELCRIGPDLWITSWHPVLSSASGRWVFPQLVAEEVRKLYNHEPVYSILLEPSDQVDAHVIEVGGIACVTLGHGLLENAGGDVRAHPFLGDYRAVEASINRMQQDAQEHRLCFGLVKNDESGLACGFAPVPSLEVGLNHREAWWQDSTIEQTGVKQSVSVF